MQMLVGGARRGGQVPDAYEAYYFPAHAYRLSARHQAVHDGARHPRALRTSSVDHHNAESPHDITHRRLHAIRRIKQTRICAHLRFRHRSGAPSSPSTSSTRISACRAPCRASSGRSRGAWAGVPTSSRRREPREVRRARARERPLRRGRRLQRAAGLARLPVPGRRARVGRRLRPPLQASRGGADELAHRGLHAHADAPRPRVHGARACAGSTSTTPIPSAIATAPFHGLSDHVPMVARCRLARGDTIPPR